MKNIVSEDIRVSVSENKVKLQKSEWKMVGVKIRNEELPLLNKLDRLNYVTLGILAKDLMGGKIMRLTDDLT